ncbi:hypothetical protein H7142_00880 [Candidatus Saccharibacteria bacterium]|nr:hypothetical protein [Candidatus Saccharibacteria bacterium]
MAEEPREVIVEREPRSHVGTIVAVVVGVIILLALLMYGLPALMGAGSDSTTNVDVQAPVPTTGTTGE